MPRSLTRILSISLTALCLCLLVASPQTAAEAVKTALSICSGIIIPSLLPFFFISGIVSALGIPECLARIMHKPMERFLGLSSWASAPLLLGLLGGYPVGAGALAQLRLEGKISPEEAERLLPVCNNTGPAFIIGAVGGGIFSSPTAGLMLYAAHIITALILALIFSTGSSYVSTELAETEYKGIISSLPVSIKGATEKCISICGFVVFFSILSSLLNELGILSSAALVLNRLFNMEIGFCKSLMAGVLELGGGIASMAGLSKTPLNLALSAFILGFGSLSVHCQTLAVVSAAKIKCARHFAGRIIHGIMSALMVFAAASVFKI